MKKIFIFLLYIILLVALFGCAIIEEQEESPLDNEITIKTYEGKKILVVTSYHEGFAWTDGIDNGIKGALDDTGVELKTFYMDTKRNADEESKIQAGLDAKNIVDQFNPDVIITADDNAQIYFVVPYIKNTSIPVVFCGVNWDASSYGYPTDTITGILEVDPAVVLLKHLKQYSQGDSIGMLSHDDETYIKVNKYWNEYFLDGKYRPFYANTYEEYKDNFIEAQNEIDSLIMYQMSDWEHEDALEFITNNTKIPTGSVDTFMAPYVLITVAKIPEEQGEWAAETALEIIDGKKPSDIPLAKNKRGKLIINLDIAEKLDIIFIPDMLKIADVYQGEKSYE